MRPAAVSVLALVGVAVLVAGCGGTKAQPAATTSAAPPLTSPTDLAACHELQTNIGFVSQLVSASVDALTHSLHPQELARRTADTRHNLLLAASVLASIRTPAPILAARNRLVLGLRQFAADFGRAQRSAARNDLATAARQLADPRALANLSAATRAIDGACGG